MADIYDGALRTIIHDCKSFVLPLINEVFGEHYTGDEKIVFHPNEHFLDQQEDPDVKRITDTSFSVVKRILRNIILMKNVCRILKISTKKYYLNLNSLHTKK